MLTAAIELGDWQTDPLDLPHDVTIKLTVTPERGHRCGGHGNGH